MTERRPMGKVETLVQAEGRWGMARMSLLNPANLLTVLRIVLVPAYLWLFAHGFWQTTVMALLVFIFAAVTDLFDGRLARSRKEVTKVGKFLDPLADKFLVLGALVQFWVLDLVWFWLVLVIFIRDVWVTTMRIVAIARGTELKTSGNAKLKTTIQLTVVITTIVFYGIRQMIMAFAPAYRGFLIDITVYRVFFNSLLAVAVAFTVYSWISYILTGAEKQS